MKNLEKDIESLWIQLSNKLKAFDINENKKDHFYLSKFVESLEYWGGEDEGTELFLSTCSLAYQMYGIGESHEALLLVFLAYKQAKESEQYKDKYEEPIYYDWGY